MKEKPMLFSIPMVKVILNTKPGVWPAEPIDPDKPIKSMTRRVIKTPPCEIHEHGDSVTVTKPRKFKDEDARFYPYEPYSVGDILWVRETWLKIPWYYEDGGEESHKYFYRADGEIKNQSDLDEEFDKWRPSIFMPREAARIFLEVKEVGVERLQDITWENAKMEGTDPHGTDRFVGQYIKNFKCVWDSINEKRGYSWENNPWVWVYEFMRKEVSL
jgi:hypothetical protein